MAKRILISLFSAVLLLSPQFVGAKLMAATTKTENNWKAFKSETSGFSVVLPAIPDHIQQSVDIPNSDLSLSYDTFVSEPSESAVYVVSVWKYPHEIDMSTPEVNLQDGFNGMLSALPNAKVQKMEMTTFQGFDALSFKVQSEDIYFQGELILVHNTLYQVFTVYKDSEDMSDNFEKFMSSFKLIKPDQHKVDPSTFKKTSRKMNV